MLIRSALHFARCGLKYSRYDEVSYAPHPCRKHLKSTMNQQTALARLLATLDAKYPSFSAAVQRNIAQQPSLFNELGGFAMQWSEAALGPSIVETIAEGYCHFVTDVNREQYAYAKRGHYRNKSYSEVFAAVYDNDKYMQYYHWGVFATLFLWAHHLRLYGFFRDRFLRQFVPEDGQLIDLGCGSGIWSILAASLGSNFQSTGVDISKSSLEVSQRLARGADVEARLNFVVADALRFTGESQFDAGMSCFLLEHLENPLGLIVNLANNLKPGAPVFLTAAITAAEVDHIYEYRSEVEVLDVIERGGFRVVEVLSATPVEDTSLAFLPRSVAVIAKKRVNSNW